MSGKGPVAFIGLGAMGFGMATQLVSQGYQVTGFDVYEPTLERFQKSGGVAARTPAEAASGKPCCVCMVATAQQAQAVLLDDREAAAPALPQGAVLLLCSTVPYEYVNSLQRQLAERGRDDIMLVDCPVSGGAGRAASGELSIMASGSDEAIRKGMLWLQALSDPNKLYIIKGGVGAGSNMKMCHQVLATSHILSAAEALGLADCMGLDLARTRDAILSSEGATWMLENRAPRMLHPQFQPLASAISIITKDTGIITSEARRLRFPVPIASTAEQAYFIAIGRGWSADDDSSLIRLYTEGKGRSGQTKEMSDDEKRALIVSLCVGINFCTAAEALTLAHRVGLDLDQVFELCVNAAGGSAIFSQFGQQMITALKQGLPPAQVAGSDGPTSLRAVRDSLEAAVVEAQTLKTPLFLGTQALHLIDLSLKLAGPQAQNLFATDVMAVYRL